MKEEKRKFFVGIDLGWKDKKTTGVCILEEKKGLTFAVDFCHFCKDIFGKDLLRVLSPYLKNTQVIAIDAPLTKGKGKGKMRLYEKFLSTQIFRREKVNPRPPALMPKLCDFSEEIVKKLERRGFVLGLNLIEVFSTFLKNICNEKFFLINCPASGENQQSALLCAISGYFHANFKTRYLGYKDGFLFLPEISYWKIDWREKFYQAWKERDRLRYRHLITNILNK